MPEQKDQDKEEIYQLLMGYIEKKYPKVASVDPQKKYDFYMRLLAKLQVKYFDYLRNYFINYLRKAEDFDDKSTQKILDDIEKEIANL